MSKHSQFMFTPPKREIYTLVLVPFPFFQEYISHKNKTPQQSHDHDLSPRLISLVKKEVLLLLIEE